MCKKTEIATERLCEVLIADGFGKYDNKYIDYKVLDDSITISDNKFLIIPVSVSVDYLTWLEKLSKSLGFTCTVNKGNGKFSHSKFISHSIVNAIILSQTKNTLGIERYDLIRRLLVQGAALYKRVSDYDFIAEDENKKIREKVVYVRVRKDVYDALTTINAMYHRYTKYDLSKLLLLLYMAIVEDFSKINSRRPKKCILNTKISENNTNENVKNAEAVSNTNNNAVGSIVAILDELCKNNNRLFELLKDNLNKLSN